MESNRASFLAPPRLSIEAEIKTWIAPLLAARFLRLKKKRTFHLEEPLDVTNPVELLPPETSLCRPFTAITGVEKWLWLSVSPQKTFGHWIGLFTCLHLDFHVSHKTNMVLLYKEPFAEFWLSCLVSRPSDSFMGGVGLPDLCQRGPLKDSPPKIFTISPWPSLQADWLRFMWIKNPFAELRLEYLLKGAGNDRSSFIVMVFLLHNIIFRTCPFYFMSLDIYIVHSDFKFSGIA